MRVENANEIHQFHAAKALNSYIDQIVRESCELAMQVAVKGMMPKNTIGKNSLKRLHIYADANYEQQAQKPVELDV